MLTQTSISLTDEIYKKWKESDLSLSTLVERGLKYTEVNRKFEELSVKFEQLNLDNIECQQKLAKVTMELMEFKK